MAEQFQWSIPANVSHQLASLTAGPRNPLSWLTKAESRPDPSPVNTTDILREAGVLDVQRNVSPTFMRVLQVLTNPGASLCIQQVLKPSSDSLAIFLSIDLAQSVAVLQAGKYFSIIDTIRPSQVMDYLNHRTGNSQNINNNFEASLSSNEAYALIAAFDCLRKKIGRSLLAGGPFGSPSLKLDEIFQEAAKPSPSPQWLVACIQKSYPAPISYEALMLAFRSLQSQNLCSILPAGINLSRPVEDLAQTMVLMDQVFELEVSRMHRNGQVTTIQQTCFQSGVHDLLLVDIEKEQVRLRTISAQTYGDQVIGFLTGGIQKIPDPSGNETGDATLQINSRTPLWELKPLGTGSKITIRDSVRVGRSPDNQLVLSETSVSRSHCLLEIIDGACWITDLGASNGTLVNGKRINLPTRLNDKDRVQLGILKFEVAELQTNDQPIDPSVNLN
jgi:hypothetical protein